jgi:hypothetical protein
MYGHFILGVVINVGMYRTGKSSLMNWLLDRPAGFAVGPTVQRQTRGIWIWGMKFNAGLWVRLQSIPNLFI